MRAELTDRFIAKAKPRDAQQSEYFDTLVKGLSLLVSASSKSWYLHYSHAGKRSRMKLGSYPEISLAQARKKAREARSAVMEGNDPLAEKRAVAASLCVHDLVENYIARQASTRRTHEEIARRLRRNVSGVIGDVKLSALHRRDLTRCIDAVKDRSADIEANRVFADARAMIRWARGRGDLDSNLMEGMSKPSVERIRDRILTPDEIREVWAASDLGDAHKSIHRILRLCLVAGQRVGEIAGMRRNELNLDQRLWTIPAERAKNRREHRVPLSDIAVAILEEQIAANRSHLPFVFPSYRSATRVLAVDAAVRRQGWTWRPHDLRRSAATMMEELGVSPFVVGHVLNHAGVTKATVTSRVYARYDYAKEKREALNLWADRLEAIIAGDAAKIVPMLSLSKHR